jgi:transcriptional regulator with XRE-family HTH domain
MTPLLCRAARALLDWTQADLAASAGVGRDTVRHFESGARVPLPANLSKIRAALADAGIRLVEESGEVVGLRTSRRGWAAQCRAARSLLGWTHLDVAKAAGVSDMTVVRFESDLLNFRRATLRVIRMALEGAGVVFLNDDGAGPGVRLKNTK